MYEVYILADPKFFNASAAQLSGKTIIDYNAQIINNANATLDETDNLILIGDLGDGTVEQMKECIDAIKCYTKKCIDMRKQKIFNTKELCRDIGINSAYTIDGFVKKELYGKKYFVTITSDYSYYEKYIKMPTDTKYEYYYAIPQSHKDYNNQIFDNKCLNISTEQWGYKPIKYDDLPQLIDDILTYEKMEGNEYENNI